MVGTLKICDINFFKHYENELLTDENKFYRYAQRLIISTLKFYKNLI